MKPIFDLQSRGRRRRESTRGLCEAKGALSLASVVRAVVVGGRRKPKRKNRSSKKETRDEKCAANATTPRPRFPGLGNRDGQGRGSRRRGRDGGGKQVPRRSDSGISLAWHHHIPTVASPSPSSPLVHRPPRNAQMSEVTRPPGSATLKIPYPELSPWETAKICAFCFSASSPRFPRRLDERQRQDSRPPPSILL